ncbi:MAG TPA: HAD-IIIC family phosphatase [Candidatus Acidoferrales bacterium]|nr:HAD-IIIC family phosphatase [Candidatus Acidoferrales bacterium]
MFEFDQYESKLHHDAPAAAVAGYPQDGAVAKLSLLSWGEHCTECAAPACYQTCDLYQARPDTRCRRFHFGIYKNRRFSSLRGYGAEVSFKKWGVLAAMGNTAMTSKGWVVFAERLASIAAPVLNAFGPLLHRLTKDERWAYPAFGLSRRFSNWLHTRNKGRSKPDAFLLEVFNPAQTVRMQLVMDYDPEARKRFETMVHIRPRFRTTVELPPGYSRHEFDRRLFQSFTETGLPFNVSLTPEADTSVRLVFLSADFVSYERKLSAGPQVKCVVWDLDNTMWQGILVEQDDVRLRPKLKELLETFDDRGILCSIASKNDHELAWQRLEALGIAEFFLAPQINWQPKSENVKLIAKKLNIGLDSLAFVDDNPFELTEVGTAVPEVLCINAQDIDSLADDPRFQGAKTADAKNRRKYYQEAIVREEKQAEFGQDYLRFLEYCEIRLEIHPYREEEFDRVAELAQRTNQLNFSGQKYDRVQLRAILDRADIEKYILHCSDRFGAYGLIGFGMVRRQAEEIEIQDLMLSCRVQGKLIEQAFFSHLESHHNPAGSRRIRVNFNATKRNQPARQALEDARFRAVEGDGGYIRDVGSDAARGIVEVRCSAGCGEPHGLGATEDALDAARG